MKKLSWLWLVTLLLLAFCKKDETQGFQIKLGNKTGFVLENVYIEGIDTLYIGKILKSQTIELLALKQFRFDSGMPDEPLIGYINGVKIENSSQFNRCGTQKKNIREGKYLIDINLVTLNNQKYLDLVYTSKQ